jgi:hypothetical protein
MVEIDPRLAAAVAFREKIGLRSDLAWVRLVADDPAAQAGIPSVGVPLMPDELAALEQRASTAKAVALVVEDYIADHPEQYAGHYIDPASGVVTAMFTEAIPAHEAALLARVRPGAPLRVRLARWTMAELGAVQARITKAAPSLAAEGMFLVSVGSRPPATSSRSSSAATGRTLAC